MTTSNLPSREYLAAQIPDQAFKRLGATILSSETQLTEQPETFDSRTPDELLFEIQILADQSGLNLSELTYEQQPTFSHAVHDVLNKHYQAQHKFEWENGSDHAIAPPLPHQWVSSRLSRYYDKAFKGDNDSVHQNNIKFDRKKFLPVAIDMANALPEINAAMDIQALLDDAGHETAADAISDLLVVYGITIHLLREKQAQLQLEKQAKAQRAAQAIVGAELLQ